MATNPPGQRPERRVLGGAVRQLRVAYGHALDPLAKRAGISAGYWCNIEAGRRNPSVPVMLAMANALGVGIDDITYVTAVIAVGERVSA